VSAEKFWDDSCSARYPSSVTFVLSWISEKYFSEQFERSSIPWSPAQITSVVGPSQRLSTVDKFDNYEPIQHEIGFLNVTWDELAQFG